MADRHESNPPLVMAHPTKVMPIAISIFIIFLLLLIILLAYQNHNLSKKVSEVQNIVSKQNQPTKVNLLPEISLMQKNNNNNNDFVLQPFSQTEPRVFKNNHWKSLPTSQTNILNNDGKLMAVCGKGGVYIYSLENDTVEYIYQKDWYPCATIEFNDVDSNILITEAFETKDTIRRLTFNIKEKKIVKEEPNLPGQTALERSKNRLTEILKQDFNRICTEEQCIELNNEILTITYQSGDANRVDLPLALGLVALRDNVLYYGAVGSTTERAPQVLMQYNFSDQKSTKLLDDFRYDYEILHFLQ